MTIHGRYKCVPSLTRLQNRRRQLRISQPVIASSLDQRIVWPSTVPDEFFRICEWNHVIVPTVQNDRACPNRFDCSPILPCGAKQDVPRIAAVDVHGDRTATGTSDDDIRLMLVELSLGGSDGGFEIVVVKFWIDDLVAVVLEVGRFGAAWDRMPAVEEEDGHGILMIGQKRKLKRHCSSILKSETHHGNEDHQQHSRTHSRTFAQV
jgi:hypothetical protein